MTDFNAPHGSNLAVFEPLFEQIKQDRNKGSRQLTSWLLEELFTWSLETRTLSTDFVEELCRTIVEIRPEMAAVYNTGYLLWSYFNSETENRNELEAFRFALKRIRAEEKKADSDLVYQAMEANFPDHDVMTFSRSSTVLMLLKQLPSVEKAVILHSYPGEEGIDMAEDLMDDIKVTFAFDVEAGYFLPKVDALYIGVDALLHDGSIVNKTGTRLLARSAPKTKVRVVTDIWKLSRLEGVTDVPRLPSPADLPEVLQRNHPVFETIPAELIDSYITNRGVFNSGQELLNNIEDLQQAHELLD